MQLFKFNTTLSRHAGRNVNSHIMYGNPGTLLISSRSVRFYYHVLQTTTNNKAQRNKLIAFAFVNRSQEVYKRRQTPIRSSLSLRFEFCPCHQLTSSKRDAIHRLRWLTARGEEKKGIAGTGKDLSI